MPKACFCDCTTIKKLKVNTNCAFNDNNNNNNNNNNNEQGADLSPLNVTRVWLAGSIVTPWTILRYLSAHCSLAQVYAKFYDEFNVTQFLDQTGSTWITSASVWTGGCPELYILCSLPTTSLFRRRRWRGALNRLEFKCFGCPR